MLQRFDVQRNSKLRFLFSNVDEFNTLNNELIRLTDKVTRDYRNLREFTENMSHETQTPLAIIRSKLEIIMQSDNLTPEQMNQVRSALDSVNRLSKMNRGLILLTRIENEQYAEEQHVPLGKLIRKQLGDLDMFIESRELKVRDEIDERVFLLMNPYLADILITNLLSNAIKYNKEGGELLVRLTASELVVGNSGDPLPIPGSQIFERFKKGNQADSVGLGLAIVKRICDHSEWKFITITSTTGTCSSSASRPSESSNPTGRERRDERRGARDGMKERVAGPRNEGGRAWGHRPLPTALCPPPTAHRPPPTAHRLLISAYCPSCPLWFQAPRNEGRGTSCPY